MCGEPSETTWRTRPTQACPRSRGLAAGAARDQPAHRVPDERDLLDLHGPRGDDLLEQVGKRAAVAGDVAAAVVADVERRAADVLRQPRAVARATAQPPGVLGLHQPVQEHDEPRRRAREGGRERIAPRLDDLAADAQRHRRLQLGALAFERVSVEARDDRQRERAAGMRRDRPAVAGIAAGERAVRHAAGDACTRRAARRRRRARSRRARAAWVPRQVPASRTRGAAIASCTLPMPPVPPPSSAAASRVRARSSSGCCEPGPSAAITHGPAVGYARPSGSSPAGRPNGRAPAAMPQGPRYIGAPRFELGTSPTRTVRATRLRYAPEER